MIISIKRFHVILLLTLAHSLPMLASEYLSERSGYPRNNSKELFIHEECLLDDTDEFQGANHVTDEQSTIECEPVVAALVHAHYAAGVCAEFRPGKSIGDQELERQTQTAPLLAHSKSLDNWINQVLRTLSSKQGKMLQAMVDQINYAELNNYEKLRSFNLKDLIQFIKNENINGFEEIYVNFKNAEKGKFNKQEKIKFANLRPLREMSYCKELLCGYKKSIHKLRVKLDLVIGLALSVTLDQITSDERVFTRLMNVFINKTKPRLEDFGLEREEKIDSFNDKFDGALKSYRISALYEMKLVKLGNKNTDNSTDLHTLEEEFLRTDDNFWDRLAEDERIKLSAEQARKKLNMFISGFCVNAVALRNSLLNMKRFHIAFVGVTGSSKSTLCSSLFKNIRYERDTVDTMNYNCSDFVQVTEYIGMQDQPNKAGRLENFSDVNLGPSIEELRDSIHTINAFVLVVPATCWIGVKNLLKVITEAKKPIYVCFTHVDSVLRNSIRDSMDYYSSEVEKLDESIESLDESIESLDESYKSLEEYSDRLQKEWYDKALQDLVQLRDEYCKKHSSISSLDVHFIVPTKILEKDVKDHIKYLEIDNSSSTIMNAGALRSWLIGQGSRCNIPMEEAMRNDKNKKRKLKNRRSGATLG
ncbi:MAG: hypothetical protein AB8G05_13525 [Oligoflexales bacterium]